jgi:hypothetical protein
MTEFTRILCPVDFSDASRHALDQAIAIAGWSGTREAVAERRRRLCLTGFSDWLVGWPSLQRS